MKKIILGLFLTIGLSGVSKSNTIYLLKSEDKAINSELRFENEDFISLDCLISNTVEIYDGCGNFLASTNESFVSNNCGDSDGGVIMNVKRVRGNNCDQITELTEGIEFSNK